MAEICFANENHINEIAEIEKECFSLPWTKDSLRSYLNDDMHSLAVALSGGRAVGYIGLMYVLDEGYISNVAVTEHFRRQGIADELIAFLISFAEKKSLSFITLEVRESNAPAIALYEKNGFHRVGLRKNYYEKPRENAILMTRFLK